MRQLQHKLSFKSGIQAVLQQVRPDHRISAKSKESVNYLLHYIGEKIVRAANVASTNATISARDIEAGVRLILPGQLAFYAVREATKAVIKNNVRGVGGRQKKSGLEFSIPRAEHLIRRYNEGVTYDDNTKWKLRRVSEDAPIYLAGVLEYLANELLELSGKASRDDKKNTINNRHLRIAIEDDEELNSLFKDIQFNGVLPNIHKEYMPKKKLPKKKQQRPK